MSLSQRVVLLVGSPRAPKSNSESIGGYLLDRLAERGLDTRRVRIGAKLPSDEKLAEILAAIDEADLVLLTAPLYVDSEPASVIRVMEYVAEKRSAGNNGKRPRFVAIVNCGFPEAYHNDVALAIYRRFACEADLEWIGGLSLGMGEMLDRQPLAKAGPLAGRMRRGLKKVAAALADGHPVPDDVTAYLAKSALPKWLYLWLGGISWNKEAKKHNAKSKLWDRPYQTPSEPPPQ